MQVGLGLQHVRTLRYEFRRKAHRQILGQLQTGKIEFFSRRLTRKPAGQNCQQVVLLGQLLEERRKRGGNLRELRFLSGESKSTDIALGELVAQDLNRLGIDVDEFAGRIDLRLQRRLLNRCSDHIGAQCDIRRDHLETNRLFLCLHRFHGPAVQTEHIGRV